MAICTHDVGSMEMISTGCGHYYTGVECWFSSSVCELLSSDILIFDSRSCCCSFSGDSFIST